MKLPIEYNYEIRLKASELREMLKKYFDAGYKMAERVIQEEAKQQPLTKTNKAK
jgi:hypothetical protein